MLKLSSFVCVCVCECSCDRHEYISGYYRVSVYFISLILADFALHTITSVVLCVIVYFIIGKIDRCMN